MHLKEVLARIRSTFTAKKSKPALSDSTGSVPNTAQRTGPKVEKNAGAKENADTVEHADAVEQRLKEAFSQHRVDAIRLFKTISRIRSSPAAKKRKSALNGTDGTTQRTVVETAGNSHAGEHADAEVHADTEVHADATSQNLDNSFIDERHCYGIRVLHDPKFATVDIVFIHGLTGNAFKTWLCKENGVHWPRDLLKRDIDKARLMTFGYDADVVNFFSHADLDDISGFAEGLLGALAGFRVGLEGRPLVFVVHSLGGLVLQRALSLSRSRQEKHLQSVETSTVGICFLGTPHHGSHAAEWGSYLAYFSQLIKPTNSSLVEALKPNSSTLGFIQRDFHQLLERRKQEGRPVEIVCFYEVLPVIRSVVVPKGSAILHPYPAYPLHSNHMDMTKFSDTKNDGYRTIVRELQRLSNVEDHRFTNWWQSLEVMNIKSHIESVSQPQKGTFTWVQHEEGFKDLRSSKDKRLIHITGKPGCGKTVLGTALFRTFMHMDSRPLAVFHAFNNRDSARNGVNNMLSSLIRQLFSPRTGEETGESRPRRQWLYDYFKSLEPETSSADILSKVFEWAMALQSLKNIVCVIDALDECAPGSERDKLVACLTNTLRSCGTHKLTIIVLSRDYWNLRFQSSQPHPGRLFRIKLDEMDAIQKDLMAVTKFNVDKLIASRPAFSSYQEQLVQKIYGRASDGMFLMVELLIDLLYRSPDSSPRGIDRTIKSLPGTLRDVYKAIWTSIKHDHEAQAVHLLRWILTALRPLPVASLADALAYEAILDDDTDELTLDSARPLDLQGDIDRLFGPLVKIRDGIIDVAHQTVKEHFLEPDGTNGSVLIRTCHSKIAEVCMLCLACNMQPGYTDSSSMDTIFGTKVSPFYTYARYSYVGHLNAAEAAGEDVQSASKVAELLIELLKRAAPSSLREIMQDLEVTERGDSTLDPLEMVRAEEGMVTKLIHFLSSGEEERSEFGLETD
ncbi:hypothetical protein K469DRAFT_691167 [Zopfia rhizophila CBS 207.26]|uniref:Nephrocystin 3-like N-terminal domain-containing protein n=1 Tax=Zopfia rhizophila CBS 207.26 TaxID=1314779 RepID=A0A6A6EN95_9PEZI|nr:hypothetical protein K469DRAFT_691167 [Zopfia rhizophila CBS 207.26]